MFPRQNRLPAREIAEILSRGKRSAGTWIKVFTLPFFGGKNQPSRLAVLVPTRLDKRATTRNRLKRQIEAVIRPWLPKAKDGRTVILVTAKPPKDIVGAMLQQEVKTLLVKVGFLNEAI